MAKVELHNLVGPDFTAFVRSGVGPLGALPYRQSVWVELMCDFSPIADRVHGRLVTWSRPSDVQQDYREVAIWLLSSSKQLRRVLQPHVEFKLFSDAFDQTQPVGIGTIKELLDPYNTRYEADAEVKADFLPGSGVEDTFAGRICDFRFCRLGEVWRGHLDTAALALVSLQPGHAFLCLHGVVVSQSPPNAGKQPLLATDDFQISMSGAIVGHGVVTRVLPPTPRILLRRPVS